MKACHEGVVLRGLAATLLAVLGACSSQPMQAGAGLATASAILVAVPLIPFVKAYDVLNNTQGKLAARFEHWNATFGPVYAQRTALIRQRDVAADVKAAQVAGPVAYLPFMPDSGLYSGVKTRPADWRENNRRIEQNPLLVYLQSLLDDDPQDRDPEEQGYRHSSKAVQYAAFAEARDQYRTAFNTQLEAVLQ